MIIRMKKKIGENGIVSWYGAGVDNIENMFNEILHQTREPLATISSITTIRRWEITNKKTFSYTSCIYIIPEIKDDNYIKQCMKYWYYWNKLAEKKSTWRYKIEDIVLGEEIYNQWCQKLSIKPQKTIINKIPKNFNTRKHKKLTIDDLYKVDKELTKKIIDYSHYLGYNIV